jgi:hypothetical protein
VQKQQRRWCTTHGLQNTEQAPNFFGFCDERGFQCCLSDRGAAQTVAHGDQSILIGTDCLGQRSHAIAGTLGLRQCDARLRQAISGSDCSLGWGLGVGNASPQNQDDREKAHQSIKLWPVISSG